MTPPEYWIEFKKHEMRLRLVAAKRGERSRRHIAHGSEDLGELEVDALINAVFLRIWEGKAVWAKEEMPFFDFFARCLHNRVRSFEQKSGREHIRVAPFEGDNERRTLDDLVGRSVQRSSEDKTVVREFMTMIYRRDPIQARIAYLHLQGFSVRQIKDQSGYPLTKIYNHIAEFKEALRAYSARKRD